MHAVLILALLAAEDWSEFRGPQGQGHSSAKRVPIQWSAAKNVAWKTGIPGRGWSSPVVVAGKAYLTTAVPGEGKALSLRVLCLDAGTGKILWDQEVFQAKNDRMHSKNSHASPTPLVADGRAYVHFGHLGTACLDTAGKILWRNRDLAWAPVHGTGGSPVLVDGLLVFSRDGASVRDLVALDAKDGKLKWKTSRSGKAPFKSFSFCTPLVITVAGQKQIVSPGSDMVGGYDARTGKEVWRCGYKGYSVIPRPVYAHGLVFLSTSYDKASVIAVDPSGKGDVTKTNLKWTLAKNAPHTPSMLAIGDDLYMVSDAGTASCVDARTGEPRWSKRLPGKGYSASPLYADGKIYFLSEDGICTIIKPGAKYEQVARNEMGQDTLASMAASDGALFIRTDKALYRIGKE